MRNLKKILALVLALVMSLSLMATASATGTAAATDAATAYKTAVDVLTGLKVVIGDAGGIRENDPITRAEAATLIYRVHTADVTDSKVYLHTDHPFTDVASTSWMNSYVSYAHNAQIVKGKTLTTFDPTANITGYETLAMTLRALGYGKNGEFEGSEWKIQTAAWSQRIGLFSNISAADSTDYALNQPASRGFVFQVMFNAVLMDQVAYSAYTPDGYSSTGKSMAQGLKLEELTGVVMANEYADLESAETLADGKTHLSVDDTTYTLDVSTGLDDIGESRLVYVHDGRTVLKMLDTDRYGVALNNVSDTDLYAKNLDDLKKEANATGNGDHFINFDRVGDRISDYKIKYVLLADDNHLFGGLSAADVASRINAAAGETGSSARAKVVPGTPDDSVEVTITPKKHITDVDLSYIRAIFGQADKIETVAPNTYNIDGEVYVGSQSVVDISDVTSDNFKYSYDRFVDEFIYTTDGTFVTGNENGNYVKVIDNNKDGKVDYVLKTVYTFAQVSRVKDDAATLDVTNHALTVSKDLSSGIETGGICGVKTDGMNNLTNEPVVCEDTLEKGDIVYYALIDGKAQATKVEPVTATIEKVDHNTWVTTTTDGAEYPASGVHEHIEDEAYSSDKKELAGKVSYDLYFDRAGNLGVFVKSDSVSDFVLITDAWYHRLINSKEYAVKIYNDETGEQDTIEIDTNASLFVGEWNSGNDWGSLKWFGGSQYGNYPSSVPAALNGDGTVVHTTVAAIAEDGTILPVENSSVTGRYQHSILDINSTSKVPTADAVKGTIYYTQNGANTAYNTVGAIIGSGISQSDNSDWTYDVRALTTTDYYVVYPNTNGDGVEVIHTVGYGSAPNVKSYNDDGLVEDIYAVGTYREAENNLGESNYFIADVVVVELNAAPGGSGELVLVVDDTARYSDVRYRDVKIINSKGEVETVKVDWTWANTLSYVDGKDQGKQIRPGFYYLFRGDDDVCMLSNNDSNKYASRVPLSAEQLRKTGVVVAAQIEKAVYTAAERYILAKDWHKTAASGYTTPEMGDTSYYTLGADTPLYTLTYNYNTYRDSNPDLEMVEPDTGDNGVLGARVDVTYDRTLSRDYEHYLAVDQNQADFNYNDVLIVHSKNAVTYLVSLDNIYKEADRVTGTPSRYTKDYAQTLWNTVMPAETTDQQYTPPAVAFFGTDVTNAVNRTANMDYSVAVERAESGKKTIVVTPTNGNGVINVLVNDVPAVKQSDSSWVFDEKVPTTQKTYNVSIIYKNSADSTISIPYTLTVNNAKNTYGLAHKGDPNTPVALTSSYPGVNRNMETIEGEYSAINDSKIKENGWKWFDVDGTDITNKSTTVADGQYAEVTVVAENGDEHVYTIMFGVEAGVAFDNKEYDVYVNSKGDVYKDVESAYNETAANKIDSANDADGWKAIAAQVLDADIDEQTDGAYSVTDEDLQWAGVAPVVEGTVTQTDGVVTPFTYSFDAIADGDGHGYVERDGAVVVRVHYCDESKPSPAKITAAKELIAGTAAAPETWDVYYFEWHADTDGEWNTTDGTKPTNTYDAQGSAEYAFEADAEAMKKPDGISSFGHSDQDDPDIFMGEQALVKKVNDALANAGIKAKIQVGGRADDLVEGEDNETTWGNDGGDPLTGDTLTYTVTFALLDLSGSDIRTGETVSVTWTVHATVNWNTGEATRDDGGKVWTDKVPDGYWA